MEFLPGQGWKALGLPREVVESQIPGGKPGMGGCGTQSSALSLQVFP